jgi:hypothetical protein
VLIIIYDYQGPKSMMTGSLSAGTFGRSFSEGKCERVDVGKEEA